MNFHAIQVATHVIFEPLDFIARLAALVPKPRFHLTRFHGVFAPNSKHRAAVTGEAKEKQHPPTETEPPPDCGVLYTTAKAPSGQTESLLRCIDA